MSDPVNHPPHYTAGRFETIAILEDVAQHYPNQVEASLAWQSIKYLCRAPLKGFYLQDLKKAQWYLTRLIDRVERRARG